MAAVGKRSGRKAPKRVIVVGKRRKRRVSGTAAVGRTHHRRRARAVGKPKSRRRRRAVGALSMGKGSIFHKAFQIVGGVAVGAYGTHYALTPVKNWIANNFPALAPGMKILETALGFYLIVSGKSLFIKAAGAGMVASEKIVAATEHLIPGISGYNNEYQVIKMPMNREVEGMLSGLLMNNEGPTYTHQVSGLTATHQVSGPMHTAQVSATSPNEVEAGELETMPLARW